MTPDNFLWAILWAGILTSVAYVLSELFGHRVEREVEERRLAQQQDLWSPKLKAQSAKSGDETERKAPAPGSTETPSAREGFAARLCGGCNG